MSIGGCFSIRRYADQPAEPRYRPGSYTTVESVRAAGSCIVNSLESLQSDIGYGSSFNLSLSPFCFAVMATAIGQTPETTLQEA